MLVTHILLTEGFLLLQKHIHSFLLFYSLFDTVVFTTCEWTFVPFYHVRACVACWPWRSFEGGSPLEASCTLDVVDDEMTNSGA